MYKNYAQQAIFPIFIIIILLNKMKQKVKQNTKAFH